MVEGSYVHRFSQHKDNRQKKKYTAELNDEVGAKGFMEKQIDSTIETCKIPDISMRLPALCLDRCPY
jgi:hypothetical protein